MRIALRALATPFLPGVRGRLSPGEPRGGGESPVLARLDGSAAATAPIVRPAAEVGTSAATDGDGRVWRIDVPGVAESVPLLRRWVRLLLIEDAELAERFELIVSEYGTNALWHTASGAPGGQIRVVLCIGTERSRLTVLDDGPAIRTKVESCDPAEHGRGLVLSDAVADETGRYDVTNGHAAWALINR